jgi:hypothetical protein
MYHFTKLTWLVIALSIYGLAACSGGKPSNDPSLTYTEIWKTVAVAQTQTALKASPTASLTNTPTASLTLRATNTPVITNTPLITKTPVITSTPIPDTPTATPAITSTLTGTQSALCDNAVGIADVTYPDGSEVVAGAPFVKTWQVKNIGQCTWNQNYHLIFGWGGAGTNWNTSAATNFSAIVLPGDSIDISVTLTAPNTAGNYSAAFRLQNDHGTNFGPEQTVVVIVK